VKATETGKGSPSQKKKIEPEPEPQPPGEQQSLFGEPKKERPKKVQVKQESLFGEASDKSYKPGQTVEFDL
jgi:hypothetical protein